MQSLVSRFALLMGGAAGLFMVAAAPVSAQDALAVVNGTPITVKDLEIYARMRARVENRKPTLSAEQKDQYLQELINRELLYQDAKKKGYDDNPDVKAEIHNQVRNIMTHHDVQKLLEEHPPSDEQMQAVYQEQVVDQASKEYKARHILVDNAQEAREMIRKLRTGSDFAELAEANSDGPSANKGGDLGWFAPNQMVKPFADAVKALNKGEFTQKPVQTRFGWHVILLEDTREVEPPPFERVSDQIRTIVQNKIISDYLEKLKADAEVSIR